MVDIHVDVFIAHNDIQGRVTHTTRNLSRILGAASFFSFISSIDFNIFDRAPLAAMPVSNHNVRKNACIFSVLTHDRKFFPIKKLYMMSRVTSR